MWMTSRRMIERIAIGALIGLATAGQANAQELWGVSVALTPSWNSGPGVAALFGANQADLHGSEIRIGFVRGIDIDSDWGLSFISTTVAANSTVQADLTPCSRGTCGTFLRTIDRTRMTGFEFHQFQPLKTWRERVQLGLIGGVGLGWMHGDVEKRVVTDASDVTTTVDAGEFYPPSKTVVPLVRVEVAVAGIIVPGFKVRASGGFGMPGYHTFNIAFIYLIDSK